MSLLRSNSRWNGRAANHRANAKTVAAARPFTTTLADQMADLTDSDYDALFAVMQPDMPASVASN